MTFLGAFMSSDLDWVVIIRQLHAFDHQQLGQVPWEKLCATGSVQLTFFSTTLISVRLLSLRFVCSDKALDAQTFRVDCFRSDGFGCCLKVIRVCCCLYFYKWVNIIFSPLECPGSIMCCSVSVPLCATGFFVVLIYPIYNCIDDDILG